MRIENKEDIHLNGEVGKETHMNELILKLQDEGKTDKLFDTLNKLSINDFMSINPANINDEYFDDFILLREKREEEEYTGDYTYEYMEFNDLEDKANELFAQFQTMSLKEMDAIDINKIYQPKRSLFVNYKKKQEEIKEQVERDIIWKKLQEELREELKIKAEKYKEKRQQELKKSILKAQDIEEKMKLRYKNILDRFNPVEGGETTLYYLRLLFRGKKYYKVGITLNDLKSRYNTKDFKVIDKVLYEKCLTHANTIEKKILKKFKDDIFPLSILSSGETEIFDRDVLELDD